MFNPDLMPEVFQVVPGVDFTVYAYMNDGRVRLVDVKPLIARGGIFERLRDTDFFNLVTVMNGTVAWDMSGVRNPSDCIDIDPCTIEECPSVPDPLEERID